MKIKSLSVLIMSMVATSAFAGTTPVRPVAPTTPTAKVVSTVKPSVARAEKQEVKKEAREGAKKVVPEKAAKATAQVKKVA